MASATKTSFSYFSNYFLSFHYLTDYFLSRILCSGSITSFFCYLLRLSLPILYLFSSDEPQVSLSIPRFDLLPFLTLYERFLGTNFLIGKFSVTFLATILSISLIISKGRVTVFYVSSGINYLYFSSNSSGGFILRS